MATWQDGLVEQIDALDRWLRGRVIIDPDPTEEELAPARSFLNVDVLQRAVERSASTTADAPSSGDGHVTSAKQDDLSSAASRFVRHYSAALTAVAVVGLSRGVGVDLSIDRCTMIIRHDLVFCTALDGTHQPVLLTAERQPPWEVSGPEVATMDELRTIVWRKLYAEHLWPIFQRVTSITNLSPSLAWTNAAEWLSITSDSAIEYLDPETAQPIVDECAALLNTPGIPGFPDDENPLAGRLEWVPGDGNGFPEQVMTRKLCCLTYLLDRRFGRLCQTCPQLPVDDRISLIRERHGKPMGSAGGDAEARSIERGLARPSTQRALKMRNS